MFPGGERSRDGFFVKLRRSRNDDGFYLIHAKQLGEIFADPRFGRSSHLRAALLINLSHRDQFRAWKISQRLCAQLSNATGANQAESDSLTHESIRR